MQQNFEINKDRLKQLKKIDNFYFESFKKTSTYLNNSVIINNLIKAINTNAKSFNGLSLLEKEQFFDELFII